MSESQSRREQLRQAQLAKAKSQRLNRIIGIGAAVLAVVVVAVFAAVFIQQAGMDQAASSTVPPNATEAKDGIVVNPGKAVDGAPVVGLYMDYQCPVCKQFDTLYGPALTSLAESGEINLQYRTMTFLDNNLSNDSSIRAGIGAACADVQGAYSDYHDEVFANQPAVEGDGYEQSLLRDTIPATIGLTGEKLTGFQQCVDDKATKAFVDGTNEAAFAAGVNGTPTLMVNGKILSLEEIGQTDPANLGALITANS